MTPYHGIQIGGSIKSPYETRTQKVKLFQLNRMYIKLDTLIDEMIVISPNDEAVKDLQKVKDGIGKQITTLTKVLDYYEKSDS